MDALSDVLSTIELSGLIFLRANLSGEYGIKMPPPTLSHPLISPATDEHRLVMFHIVREGRTFAEIEGFEPRELSEGDLVIVIDDLHHSVVDSPGRETVASSELVPDFSESYAPPAVHLGEGERSLRLVCGMFQFVDRGFNPVFEALPPFLHISKEDAPLSSWLHTNVDHVVAAVESGRPGNDILLGRLTELLFVETIRGYLEHLPEGERGWFSALKDPQVGQALQLLHASPAHPWTVAELAHKVGASRSSFSARFTELLEASPITYLTRWRIRLATNLLDQTQQSLQEIATRIGYKSEASFNRAFRREMGSPPATWRRRRTLQGTQVTPQIVI